MSTLADFINSKPEADQAEYLRVFFETRLKASRMGGDFVATVPYTPLALIEEMFTKIPPIVKGSHTANIAVLYTIEMAMVLHVRGFTNITVVVREHDEKIKAICVGHDFTYLLESELGDMKFDVVVMNPPFNDARSTTRTQDGRRNKGIYLHTQFIELSLNIADYVCVICPVQEWFLGRGFNIKREIQQNKRLARFDLLSAENAATMFGVTTGVLGIFHFTPDKNLTTEVLTDGVLCGLQPSSEDYTFGDQNTISILNKLKAYTSINQHMEVSTGPKPSVAKSEYIIGGAVSFIETVGRKGEPIVEHKASTALVDGTHQVYKQKSTGVGSKDYTLERNTNLWRLCMGQAGERRKLSTIKVISPGALTSYSINTIGFQTQREANNAALYLNSNVVKFVIHHTHTSSSNGKTTFRNVPDLDLTRSWTDAELYEHFNITQEEIDLIEANIK